MITIANQITVESGVSKLFGKRKKFADARLFANQYSDLLQKQVFGKGKKFTKNRLFTSKIFTNASMRNQTVRESRKDFAY